jgi:hypothetical protein
MFVVVDFNNVVVMVSVEVTIVVGLMGGVVVGLVVSVVVVIVGSTQAFAFHTHACNLRCSQVSFVVKVKHFSTQ